MRELLLRALVVGIMVDVVSIHCYCAELYVRARAHVESTGRKLVSTRSWMLCFHDSVQLRQFSLPLSLCLCPDLQIDIR